MLVAGDGQVLLIDLELATLAARETCEALHPPRPARHPQHPGPRALGPDASTIGSTS